jgi:hypothetical protein
VNFLFILLRLKPKTIMCHPALEEQYSKYTDEYWCLGTFSELATVESLNLHIVSREPSNFHGAPSCINLFCTNRLECVGIVSQFNLPGIPSTHIIPLMLWILRRPLVFIETSSMSTLWLCLLICDESRLVGLHVMSIIRFLLF